jgi:hypothetical protein
LIVSTVLSFGTTGAMVCFFPNKFIAAKGAGMTKLYFARY